MTELKIQEKVLKKLRVELFKKWAVKEEQAHLNGCTDIQIIKSRKNICIEIKRKPNMKLFEQLEKQKLFATHLVAVSMLPKNKKTKQKWEKIASSKMINLIYLNDSFDLKKQDFLRVKNSSFDRNFYQKVYL